MRGVGALRGTDVENCVNMSLRQNGSDSSRDSVQHGECIEVVRPQVQDVIDTRSSELGRYAKQMEPCLIKTVAG